MEENKRKFIRVEYNISVIVETGDMAIATSDGILKDIGSQGFMLEVKEKLLSGLLVRVHLKIKKDIAPLIGYVMWIKKIDDIYRVGIKLDASMAEQNDRVLEVVSEQIISEINKKHKKQDFNL